MKSFALTASAVVLSLCAALPAAAESAGDWTLGFGLGYVAPKSDNGTLTVGAVDVGTSIRPTVTFEYFIRDNLGIEVLGALPVPHAINVAGLGKVGTTLQLPPVVSVQYHFDTGGKVTPFIGAGINYTVFFEEKAKGAIAGANLKLKDSAGLALHAGFDYKINDRGAVRADIRWADIDTDVMLNGTKIGTAEIDPVVVGVSYILKF